MQDGAAALIERKKTSDGVTVTYSRGLKAITITAWSIGQHIERRTDDPGASVVVSDRDYAFAVADLIIDGQQVGPAKDDRIEETIDGQRYVFEVSVAPGSPPAEHADEVTRQMWLVHTKRRKAV